LKDEKRQLLNTIKRYKEAIALHKDGKGPKAPDHHIAEKIDQSEDKKRDSQLTFNSA